MTGKPLRPDPRQNPVSYQLVVVLSTDIANYVYLPYRVQGESIAYGLDGKTLWLTSEEDGTGQVPLWKVTPR
jgi:hypothetical protein